jgi:hypothetical protein
MVRIVIGLKGPHCQYSRRSEKRRRRKKKKKEKKKEAVIRQFISLVATTPVWFALISRLRGFFRQI